MGYRKTHEYLASWLTPRTNALINEIYALFDKQFPQNRIDPDLEDRLERLKNDLTLLAEIIDFFNIYTVEKLYDS